MFRPKREARVWLVLGRTDMRKGINGLSNTVAHTLEMDPLTGHYFVFCNRRRTTVKILYYDRNGFALWMKALQEDRFAWPKSEADVRAVTAEQLEWLLAGLDIERAHGVRRYSM